jgi:hypothetical protein
VPSIAAPPGAPAPAATASPVPTTVTAEVTSEPAGAEVYRALDGLLLGTTPFRQELARSPAQAVYVLKLGGYEDVRVKLPADRDANAHVRLSPLAPAATPAAAHPRPRSRPKPETPAPRDRAFDEFNED